MKKIVFISLILSFSLFGQLMSQPSSVSFKRLEKTHDLVTLSKWGPYSKKYAGISHIPEIQQGFRFDFSVMPGYYFYKTLVPNVRFESGYYPWQVNATMDRVTYRYELEWKDLVYTDVTYSIQDSATVLVGVNCVNNTSKHQVISLNTAASLEHPENYPRWNVSLPKGVQWINALSYIELSYVNPGPRGRLVYNGWLLGESRSEDYIDSRAVARRFGKDSGDKISFHLSLAQENKKGLLCFRYRMKENTTVTFQLSGLVEKKVSFKGTGNFELLKIPYESRKNTDVTLTMESLGKAEIELNGFFVGDKSGINAVRMEAVSLKSVPQISRNTANQSLLLKYPETNDYYGIAWDFPSFIIRELHSDELDIFLREHEHNTSTRRVLKGNEKGHFTNLFLRPVEVDPNSSKKIFLMICTGEKSQVENRLSAFQKNRDEFLEREVPVEKPFRNILPEGKPFVFSQKMMQATVLTNVVYPIYTQSQFIRHFTPGKRWNSLYTWDNGFIALGLNEIDPEKAVQCLNTYTTPPGSQSAFIHHGTPVPVQIYAFLDYWNRTQSAEFLSYFYPRMKQYYEFLAGKINGSTTNNLKSNLLRTWDYFYNSGGWDDYPPQIAVHEQKLEKSVTPVANTAHIIRVAKILRLAAETLKKKEDVADYDSDIKLFSQALQAHAWDEKSGYYSYVAHDLERNPTGFLKYSETGENYNMGLDGAYPILSGICTESQQDMLLERIFSEHRMWTPAGIVAVDQSAPYYTPDGYWNGWVWMPHQWFLWKSMLDIGRPGLAFKIASKALNIWKKEVDDSYHAFEIFQASTGRGAGWHQFSGLSTPVLNWFSAYYKPGTVTTGFEIWIREQVFSEDFTNYKATLIFDQATDEHERSMIICMNPEKKYKVLFKNTELKFTHLIPGQLQITLPATNETGELKVVAVR